MKEDIITNWYLTKNCNCEIIFKGKLYPYIIELKPQTINFEKGIIVEKPTTKPPLDRNFRTYSFDPMGFEGE